MMYQKCGEKMKSKKTIIVTLIVLLIVIALLFFVCFILSRYHSEKSSPSTFETSSSAAEFVSAAENEAEFQTDNDYIKRKQNIKSNAELTNLNEEYAEIWHSKMDLYYQSLYDFYVSQDNTQMICKTQLMKEQWDSYYTSQMSYYEKFIMSVYESGSIVPIKLSDCSRILYRNKAIELYYLCLDCMIKVDAP